MKNIIKNKKILIIILALLIFIICYYYNINMNIPLFVLIFSAIIYMYSIQNNKTENQYNNKNNFHPIKGNQKANAKALISEGVNMIEENDTTFENVAGMNEVKEEFTELVDFILNPTKYTKLGASLPKGVLLYGPPGSGKTLLAKAFAGESNSKFLFASGSEFVEKYVGVGAKRVRQLFDVAKKNSPAVIFIDELDSIGSKRTSDSNNEKDQTLNQLLVELDGFSKLENVLVIGATNRIDLLDEALLRPNRFDRHILVGNPDQQSRKEIFLLHTKNKKTEDNIDFDELAKLSQGMSGAEIYNICNEAAIFTVRGKRNKVSKEDFENAIEKVLAGLQRKSTKLRDNEKVRVAIHEIGHALQSYLSSEEKFTKISIIPRNKSLGYVMNTPGEDKFLYTLSELESRIMVMLSGKISEELMLLEASSGAQDDLKKANEMVKKIVCNFGLSSLGNRCYDENDYKHNFNRIDEEITILINSIYDKAKALLMDKKDLINYLSKILIKKEEMSYQEFVKNIDNFYKLEPAI